MEMIKNFLASMNIDIDVVIAVAINVAIIFAVMFVLLWINRGIFKTVEKNLVAHGKAEYSRIVKLAGKVVKTLVIFVSLVAVLYQIPGLEQLMTSLLASSGILAIAIGLASQDAASNLISGLMVSVFKPFSVGDVIKLVSSGTVGTVEEITLRHTVLRTIENKRVIVPNSTINSETIENAHFGDTAICNYIEVGVTYESDIEKAKAVCLEEALKNERLIDRRTPEQTEAGDPIAVVCVLELADSSVTLRIACWTIDNASGFAAKCEIREALKNRFDSETGIDMAYPHIVVVNK